MGQLFEAELSLTGLECADSVQLYTDGIPNPATCREPERDNKLIFRHGDRQCVVNFPDGYCLDVPADWRVDFSLSPVRIRYTGPYCVLNVTCEKIIYDSREFFFQECFDRHMKDPGFWKANRITETRPCHTETVGEYTAEFQHLRLDAMPEGALSHYTYVKLYNDSPYFYFFLFKSSGEEDIEPVIRSFRPIPVEGTAVYSKKFEVKIPSHWTKETRACYDRLCSRTDTPWGIYCADLLHKGMDETMPRLEAEMEDRFELVSQYVHYSHDFTLELARKVHDSGRLFQMSYQYTTSNNTHLEGYTPVLDIYRGECDEVLRNYARQIKAYGEPMLFRLNNEMNTDWTSYCGLVNMLDPDIFIETWVRLYRIFEEEGVDNCIWIFNPSGDSFPPCRWADFINYMPPSEYVQMMGVTAYCPGHGGFDSYEKLYAKIEDDYRPFFMDWPWIISEFGCGPDDGTKIEEQARWIRECFDCMAQRRFPNIKAAIWFSANDYNPDGSVHNGYQLNPDIPQVMAAFREGFQKIHHT